MSLLEELSSLVLPAAQRQKRLEEIASQVSPENEQWIRAMAEVLPEAVQQLQQKDLTAAQLRRLIFGAKTEKMRTVCPSTPPPPPKPKGKRPGHGRKGAREYTGAQRVSVPHLDLHAGMLCPDCRKGKLRGKRAPKVAVTVTAQPPIAAVVHEMESLRCDLCGKIFTAPTPAQAGAQKYDPTVGVMVAVLRYGSGMPLYRLEGLQHSMGVPLPASTQWELVEEAARTVQPAFDHLAYLAAQAPTVYNDDTTMRVGDLRRQIKAEVNPERTGIFTTGIVASAQDHPIALFFTGRRHAGENLGVLLRRRQTGLPPPIQMCDGLARNAPKEFKTLLANCLVHSRRDFVDVAEKFPEECRHVLESLSQVYRFDAQAKETSLSPEARLQHHQTYSQPVMEELHQWLQNQLDEKKVEPNSGLGKAISYMLRHWEPLTLFLRVAGAPLDNNVTERALKMAILHRKNSIAYKTERGAQVGDLFMSLIHSCRLNNANPFDYLVALIRNIDRVKADPAQWMPWNFREAMASPIASMI